MNFDTCMTRLLDLEKGYKPATPSDPGGETNWGIAKRWHPDVDIKNLTREQAAELYRANEWSQVRGDELPLVIAWQVLDFAVNSSSLTAIRWLQAAMGVTVDGILGPVTLAALQAVSGPAMAGLILRLNANRLQFMDHLQNWLPNSVGWSNRIAANLRYAADDLKAMPSNQGSQLHDVRPPS